MNAASLPVDPLLGCLLLLARWHGRPVSADALRAGGAEDGRPLSVEAFMRLAPDVGLVAHRVAQPLAAFGLRHLPAVLLLRDGSAVLLQSLREGEAELVWPEAGGTQCCPLADLEAEYAGEAIIARADFRLDARAGEMLGAEGLPGGQAWFWGTLLRYRRQYLDVALASVLINLFAVASSLFAMNVYDRVVPNRAMETLWVLAVGVGLGFVFDFVLRNLRGVFLDSAGKKADLLISSALFRQVLSIRLEKRPASSGSMASTLREFESLRDFLTSASLVTLVDLPFFFLFLCIIAYIGGSIVWVPVVGALLSLVFNLLLQAPLARAIRLHQAEAAQKQGLLVESIAGLETLRAVAATGSVLAKWERLSAMSAESSARSRFWSALAVNFTLFLQQMVSVAVVVVGVYRIGDGALTMGALIACNILAGRALAPLGQVASLLMRYQGARLAYVGLNRLMRTPTERDAQRQYLHRHDWAGGLAVEQLAFAYPGTSVPVVQGLSFSVRPGERVAVVGRTGSGKTSLLKLLDGLYVPQQGTLRFDGVDCGQIDPVDLRRLVGYLGQEPRLFFGSLRENLALGAPGISDDALLAAARLAGIDQWVLQQPNGLDRRIGEQGEGLSGGQRQAVALARLMVRAPGIVLLDEPTAALDHNAEQALLGQLDTWLQGRTLILVTHKPAMLALVDRLIVLEEGRIVADGPKEKVLQAMGVRT